MKSNVNELMSLSKKIRANIIKMAFGAGKEGSHFGGSLSSVEILVALYKEIANIDCFDPTNPNRDRILISKGHCAIAYYNVLYECGLLKKDDILHYEKDGYDMPGHPIKNTNKGIEYGAGSLGMALSVGVGMAIDAKRKKRDNKVYVLLGDGECEEGSIWEAVLCAAHNHLDNLIIIVDRNHLQYDGRPEEIAGLSDIEKKFTSFGCKTIVADDGHNIEELLQAFHCNHEDKPLVIVANTVKGKGVSFMEDNAKWHYGKLTEKEYELALLEQQ